MQGRKLRPKSIVDESETPDLVMTSTPNSYYNTPTSIQVAAFNGASSEVVDTVPELPSASALTHLGKARPKRPKKHAPTRGTVMSRPNEDSSFDEGMDKFYTSSANNSFSPGSSPPSGSSPLIDEVPRMGSISSTSSLLKTSSAQASKEDLSATNSSSTLERKSASKLGMSCLASNTTDEDTSALVKSPEKKTISPSVQSISDIFAKSVKNRTEETTVIARSVSPFAVRRGDEKKPPLAEEERTSSPDIALDGKKTPDDLVRRHGVGHGTNPDLMAEIKEKRASMAPHKQPNEEEKSATEKSNQAGQSGLFSGVRLRSTGLAANLTSPTNEFTPKERSNSGDDTIEKDTKTSIGTTTTPGASGSILGLRSAKFSNLEKKSSPSPEAKPRSALPASNNEETSPPVGLKPKPLPKPRPWSIVGVDRKSGEVTSVINSGEKNEKPAAGEKPKGASVRDLINNMNKDVTSTTSSEIKTRKVSSLPRGTQPPTGPGSSDLTTNNPSANSPKLSKKTDSTSDDPRILKLEDDYAYDGVMDV